MTDTFCPDRTADAVVALQEHVLFVSAQIRTLIDERDKARRIAGELADALDGTNTDALSVERSERLGRAWLAVPQEWRTKR